MTKNRKTLDLLHAVQEDRAECAPIERSEDSAILSIDGDAHPDDLVFPVETAARLSSPPIGLQIANALTCPNRSN
jgi:hypothetical protein